MPQIIPLSEGSFTVDATKRFMPFHSGQDKLSDRPRGSLLVEIQPFLVISSRDHILIDTGLGFRNPDGVLQLHQNLIRSGVNPLEVTKVLVSHLHKDHAGGIGHSDPLTGTWSLSFPEALYYVNRRELDYAKSAAGSSYQPEVLRLLELRDNIRFTGSEGWIDGYIHYEVTGGHSPYHQVFLIEDGGEILFFGGDIAPQASQMKGRFLAKYDEDGHKSLRWRETFASRGKKESWTFLYYHDIHRPYGRLEG